METHFLSRVFSWLGEEGDEEAQTRTKYPSVLHDEETRVVLIATRSYDTFKVRLSRLGASAYPTYTSLQQVKHTTQ